MGDFFRVIGVVGWGIGGWLLYAGLAMDVAVSPDGQGYVANLQLMHMQHMNLLLGALALIEGTICVLGGFILDRLPPSKG